MRQIEGESLVTKIAILIDEIKNKNNTRTIFGATLAHNIPQGT